jgi:4-diphosphocytidyl-2-C-methyl-D-erythritol kinase
VLEEAGGPVLSDTVLRMLARTLGADVAFFLDSRPAIGRGIGELLEPLSLPSLDLVLVFLEHHLSTAKVYRAFDALRQPEGKVDLATRAGAAEACWLALADAMTEGTLGGSEIVAALAGLLENDLEEASFGLFPPLVAAKQALFDEGASGCLMSGSGPTLYGVCESRATAAELCRRVQRRGLNARVARAGRLGDNPVLS